MPADVLKCVRIEGCSYPLSTFPLSYKPGTSYRYEYVTDTLLNEASDQLQSTTTTSQHPGLGHQHQQTGARRGVGFRLTASVDVTPVWTNNNGVLIVKLQVKPWFHVTIKLF